MVAREQVMAMPDGREIPQSASCSLRQVFEEHAPFVCRSLRRLGVSEVDLDDMLQEVFVVVHKRLPDYVEVGRTRSWLYSICTRVAQAHRRKGQRRRESLMPEPPEQSTAAEQQTGMESSEALLLGRSLLSLLPMEQREVFVLYEVEELTMPEIADALGCPLQTGYSRLHKARERIVTELARLRSEQTATSNASRSGRVRPQAKQGERS